MCVFPFVSYPGRMLCVYHLPHLVLADFVKEFVCFPTLCVHVCVCVCSHTSVLADFVKGFVLCVCVPYP